MKVSRIISDKNFGEKNAANKDCRLSETTLQKCLLR